MATSTHIPERCDPFARVRVLGDKGGARGRGLGVATALLLHGILSAHAWAAARDAAAAPRPAPAVVEIAIETEPAPAPREEALATEGAPTPRLDPAPNPRAEAPGHADAAPKAAADPYEGAAPSKAPEVLTAGGAAASGPSVASGDGSGPGYGAVAGAGTAAAATFDRDARIGASPVPAPTATAPAPPPPVADLSRSPALVGGNAWRCPFPPEADGEGIDEAVATIVVTVAPDGTASAVSVTSDPGHGFGRAARACAFARHYTPGLDSSGAPRTAPTAPIRVRFTR